MKAVLLGAFAVLVLAATVSADDAEDSSMMHHMGSDMSWDNGTDGCTVPKGGVYQPERLPPQSCGDFDACKSSWCECAGMEFVEGNATCKAPADPSGEFCPMLTKCSEDYIACVNRVYVEEISDNCTNALVDEFQLHAMSDASSTSGNNVSDTFFAENCAFFVCKLANESQCGDLSASDICAEPPAYVEEETYEPGYTPAPTNADGSFVGGTNIVTINLLFVAEFDTLVSTVEGRENMKTIMTSALTTKLKYKTVAKLFSYQPANGGAPIIGRRKQLAQAAGNLDMSAQAGLAVTDPTTQRNFLKRLTALQTDTNTDWLNALKAACGCSIPPPTITFSIRAAPPAPTGAPNKACGSGCIAGVVIGGTAAVVGVGAVVAYVHLSKPATAAATPNAPIETESTKAV